MNSEVTGTARIGIIGTTARWLTSRLLEAARDAHPRLRVIVVDATTTSLLPQLDAGESTWPWSPAGGRRRRRDRAALRRGPRAHHPTRPPARGPRLRHHHRPARHPLLLGAKGTALRDDLDVAAADVGVELDARAEIDGMRLLAFLAFEGFGAAVLLLAAAVPGGTRATSAG